MAGESFVELWHYRELLFFFAWREVKVRYRQAAFGVAWALIQPLFAMITFTLLFGRLAHLPSEGIPYPIFCYSALVPWTYFSVVVAQAANSLVNNEPLLTKVYFPRVLLPAGTILAGLVDLLVGSILLVGLMLYYNVRPSWALLLSPLVIFVSMLVTMGVSMLLAAANVKYRDVRHAVPFLLQMWMFATPVIYPVSMIPQRFRPILALNPCWGMVSAFRACLFPQMPFDLKLIGTSIGVAIIVFLGGGYYFLKAEKSFADLI